MKDSDFLWKGSGSIMVDPASLPDFPKDIYVDRGIFITSSIAFPPFSRLPKSAVTAERLEYFICSGQASLSDAGMPGLSRSAAQSCFEASCAIHGTTDADRFREALRVAFKSARDGKPWAEEA